MTGVKTKIAALASLATAALLLNAPGAGAHTDAGLVAVPAGEEAVLELKPTHGCGDSPTVEVAIQAPVAGAEAQPVDGWTATSTDGGDGTTVLEWKGGSLPADQTGAFPVRFTAPDTPGELLLFPSIQVCANGEELAWISGDPSSETPAPRLLVLPAGSAPAASIDDVPTDAPGRDQLEAIVDVDNPAQESTTTAPDETSTTTEAAPADETTTTTVAEPAAPTAEADDEDDGSSAVPIVIGVLVVLALVGGGAAIALRKRAD